MDENTIVAELEKIQQDNEIAKTTYEQLLEEKEDERVESKDDNLGADLTLGQEDEHVESKDDNLGADLTLGQDLDSKDYESHDIKTGTEGKPFIPDSAYKFDPDIMDFEYLKGVTRKLVDNNPKLRHKLTVIFSTTRKDPRKHYNIFLEQVEKQGVTSLDIDHAYEDYLDEKRRKKMEEHLKLLKKEQSNQESEPKPLLKNKKKYNKSEAKEIATKLFEGPSKGKQEVSSSGGLYDDEIDTIMSRYKDFKGCIMRDEIKKLLPDINHQSRVAFIINTQDHDKPGMHWDAVYIDARNGPESSNSLEWYDSFGRSIPSDILEDCKLILKVLKPATILKVKENKVIHQKDETSNCGWFCCKFLIDRFRGQPFSEATGYDDKIKINHSNEDEAEIERLKKTPPFKYIY